MIYFDCAATSLEKPTETKEKLLFSLENMGNPSRGGHGVSHLASREIFATRLALAKLISAPSPHRISFTPNCTTALNLAISGLFSPGDHLLTGTWSHNSMLRPLYQLEKRGCTFDIFSQKEKIDLISLKNMLKPESKALLISHASNVTGELCDLQELGDFCRENNLLFLVDSAQTTGIILIDVQKMHIDVLCFSGHKSLYATTGTAGIYVSPEITIPPLVVGGSGQDSFGQNHPQNMPESLEAGTLNVHGIASLLGGLQFLEKTGIDKIYRHGLDLAEFFTAELKKIPTVQIYGRKKPKIPTVAFNLGSQDSVFISDYLWRTGEISCRGGIHCAPLLHQSFGTQAQGMVRFSFSYFNSQQQVEQALILLRKCQA